MNWAGVGNGDLLRLAAAAEFDAVITNDGGLEYQQNFDSLPVSVVALISDEHD